MSIPISRNSPEMLQARYSMAVNSAQEGYISFGDAATLLWRRKKTLLSSAAAGLLLALVLIVTQRPVYEAKTTIEVEMPNEDYLNRRQLNPVVEPGIVLVEPFVQTQLRLMQTDTILLSTIDKLGARRQYELSPPAGKLTAVWRRMSGSADTAPKDASTSALLENLRKRLTIRTVGQTQIIEVLYQSSDPAFAAKFVNSLADEYRIASRGRMVDATSQTAQLLSGQMAELKQSVDEAENRLSGFVAANSLVVPSDKESFIEAQFRQTQTALGVAHESRVAEQSRYETVRNADPEALAKVLDSDTLKAYRVKLTDLRQKLAEAVELYKPAHYSVRQIEAEIKEVETAFARERAGILARLREQYESAQFREDSLRQDYERQAGVVAAQMGKSIRFTALKRDLDTRRQLYETALQKVKEAGLISAMQASNVRVLDPAVPPEKPIKPNKLLYTAVGLTSGIFYGLVSILFSERHELGRQSAAAMALTSLEAAEIRILGSIPRLASESEWPELLPPEPAHELSIHQLMPRRTASMAPALAPKGALELTAFRKKDSDGARAFESVVKQILFSPRAKRPRVITITSACHGEGRTTVVCNLGAALARTGRVVLIIDGDRINPRLHDVFGIPNETGFTDLIAAHTDGSESAASEAVWMTEVPGLFVLPGGRAMGRLATLADDPRSTAVLDGFCRDFDVILVDAPPVLSPGEATSLGMHSDAVILVVRDGCASPELVAAAEQKMAGDGMPVAGRILNCHEEPASRDSGEE